MSTLKRILASRANGAKSHGPSTELGKQRSARNATRHGILSKTIVLRDEDPEAFRLLVAQYIDKFEPNGELEHAAVEELAIIQWRLRRLRLIEKTLLNESAAMSRSSDPAKRLADAFVCRAGGSPLNTVERYETKLTRMYQRALEHYFLLRELCPEPVPAAAPQPAVPITSGSFGKKLRIPSTGPDYPKHSGSPEPISTPPAPIPLK